MSVYKTDSKLREIVHEPLSKHRGRKLFVKWYSKVKVSSRIISRRRGFLRDFPQKRLPD